MRVKRVERGESGDLPGEGGGGEDVRVSREPSQYVHGTDPVEQRRLSALNALLNETSLAAMAPRSGERVLDVGSGLGQLTRLMARATGVRALGIERSAEQIAEARRQASAAGEDDLIELRQGDAMDLPLAAGEWGSFDVAHARFVLEHVPDPLGVVRQMLRALKTGGRLVLEDDDHEVLRLFPEPRGFTETWRTYMRTYDLAGNDPLVGRKLVSLMQQAGATPRRNDLLTFGGCAGEARFQPLIVNIVRILEGARDAMAKAGPPHGEAFDAALRELEAWGRRPDAAIWFGRCWAEGVKAG
jgi:ubiquinone/menaquinone biosynthesis C-methylase UbiE